MKKALLVLLVTFICLSAQAYNLKERIQRYGGKNSSGLLDLIANVEADTMGYVEFLLQNCSDSDLAVLDAEYLMENIRYALKAKEFKYANYDEDIFLHFVLPHRMSQEPLEDWRPQYYNELKDLVSDAEEIEEAAILVNIWCLEQMTYKPTHGRDQSAFTSAKRGFGRCEEMMIIYMCAARAVGIPVRSCSAPYWNFTNSNHAWIEVWTPNGWKYLGEPASQLSKTWFTRTTERATIVTAKAFGNYDHKNTIKQEDNVTTLSSIEYYTNSYDCTIKVIDEEGNPVDEAYVMPYAVSFGGIWPLVEMKTDEKGICSLPLGKSSTFFIAGKDSLTAWQMFDNLDGKDHEIEMVIKADMEINTDLEFKFPLPGSNPKDNQEPEFFAETFKLMRENADLKRKNRLQEQKHTIEFSRYYDLVHSGPAQDEDYFEKRREFLDKSDQLAANADDFLHVYEKTNENGKWVIDKMITSWDIKDLCEIPDSTALMAIVDIYKENRFRFAESDSLFTEGCIARTWRSGSPVQNGWQAEFYEYIKPLLTSNEETTVTNIILWAEDATEVDEDFIWTYYSGSLNPLEIFNLHYVPEFYRTKLINSALKLAGIPVRWQGRLEFHNGLEWIAVFTSQLEEEESELCDFSVEIYVDGVQVKAEPYENFLVASISGDGYLYNTWFDGKNDSLAFKGQYRQHSGEIVHLEAAIRNDNGDAAVAVRPLSSNAEIILNMDTPKEFLDNSENWAENTLESIKSICDDSGHNGSTIVLVLAEKSSEPQVHTIEFLAEKLPEYTEMAAKLIIYAENRSLKSLETDKRLIDASFIKGEKIMGNLNSEDYPAVFLLDKNNELIFSSTGYNMGIADLIKKKLKKLQ